MCRHVYTMYYIYGLCGIDVKMRFFDKWSLFLHDRSDIFRFLNLMF